MSESKRYTILIVGAAGRVGRLLSLELAKSAHVGRLLLNDTRALTGLTAEMSLMDISCRVATTELEALDAEVDIVYLACAPSDCIDKW